MSVPVRLHGTTGLRLDGFSFNMVFNYFAKICPQIKVSLKSDKNHGYFTWTSMYNFYNISFFFLEWEMFQKKKFVHIIKTHILCSVPFFFFLENRAFYEIMWKKIFYCLAGHGRQYDTCALHAGFQRPHTHTIIAFPPQQWLHEHCRFCWNVVLKSQSRLQLATT